MPFEPKRYSDDEVSKILRLAMTRHERGPERDGMTLDELVRVAAEAGIDPEAIVKAAEQFESGSRQGAPAPWLLGVRPYTEIVGTVEGEPTDENWDEVVAELRSAFRGPTGEATRLGKSSEWYGGSELTATQVSLTPVDGKTKVKLRLTAWAVPLFAYGFVGLIMGMAVFVKASQLFKSDQGLLAGPVMVAAIAVWIGAILLTRVAVGRWYKSKLAQMHEALKRVGGLLERSPAPQVRTATVQEPAEAVVRLGNPET